MDRLLLRLAEGYTVDADLPVLQVLAIAWSGADLLLIVAVLCLAAEARKDAGGRWTRVRWAVFALTALLTPLLCFVRTPIELFYLDAGIALPQFAILLHALIADREAICTVLAKRVAGGGDGA